MRYTVMVVGSSLKDKGGIVSVMKNIEEDAQLNKKFKFIHIDTYNNISLIKKLYMYVVGLIKVIYIMISKKVDLVHIHMSYKGSFYRKSIIILLVKLFKKPIILHMHGSCFKEFYNGLGKIPKAYCNYIFNSVDELIVLSQSWKSFFSEFVDKKKIIIINNSVPISEKQKIIKKSKKDSIVFLYLGRMGERKGIYDLLNVIEKLNCEKRYVSKFKFILAGDGEIEIVNKIINEKNLKSCIHNVGWIDNEQKEEILINSDVFVLPSYNEGLPMALLESMSYKLPCISTKVGGIPEILENSYNGYINDPGDNDSLYISIVDLIEHENNRLIMGENAFNVVYERFNQEKELLKVANIYMTVISKK